MIDWTCFLLNIGVTLVQTQVLNTPIFEIVFLLQVVPLLHSFPDY